MWLGGHLLFYLPTSRDTSTLGGWVLSIPIRATALAIGGVATLGSEDLDLNPTSVTD